MNKSKVVKRRTRNGKEIEREFTSGAHDTLVTVLKRLVVRSGVGLNYYIQGNLVTVVSIL